MALRRLSFFTLVLLLATFILVPVDPVTTRLVIRSRGPESPSLVQRLFWMGVFQPAHFIMERKMMLKLKALSEQRYATSEMLDGIRS